MEDKRTIIEWLQYLAGNSPEDLDDSGLVGMAPPEGAVKTGVFLDDEQKAVLGLLRQQVLIAGDLWRAYQKLTPADQKVQPFTELMVQCERCRQISLTLKVIVITSVPASFYGFVGAGFDDSLEIWVGPRIRRDLGDLPNPLTLYPPRF